MSLPEPFSLVSLSASVVANIATDILKYRLQNWENSSLVGQILKRLGFMEQNLDEHLQGILSKTLTFFFELYPQYRLSGVINFLRDPATGKMFCGFILDRQIINQKQLSLAFAKHLGTEPITRILIEQRDLDSEKIISDFIECYRKTLNEQLNIPQVAVLLSVLEQKNSIIQEMKSSEERLQTTVMQIGTQIQIQQSSLKDIQNSVQTILQILTNQVNTTRQTTDLTAISYNFQKPESTANKIDTSRIQMDMPDSVSIKFDLYTLACHEFSKRLIDLQIATQSDSRLNILTCINRFDEILHAFFQRSIARNREEASEKFSYRFQAEVQDLYPINKRVGAIFDDLRKVIASRAPSWEGIEEIEQFHIQSRNLAKQFYATSPWLETQNRLSRRCNVVIQCDSTPLFGDDQVSTSISLAPTSYFPNYFFCERRKKAKIYNSN